MDKNCDIAIVGISGRFPGAGNFQVFWSNLIGGAEPVAQLSDQEMIEVDAMGPQNRLLLELADTALEDAACDPDRFTGRIGVFIGSTMNIGLKARLAEDNIPPVILSDKNCSSSRISCELGLHGPSGTIQRPCSTVVAAIHLAGQSLLKRERDMALAGGGGGVIVMRRLADAQAEGDHIYAVMNGSAFINDNSANAHINLEESPAGAPKTDSEGPHLLVLSAKTSSALDIMSRNLADFLECSSSDLLADAAYTLQTGRRYFPCRRFAVCSRTEDAVAALRTPDSKKTSSESLRSGPRRPVVFLLPGIGDHYVGMGQELYEHFSVFRQEVDRCAQILQPLLDIDVREILYPPNRVRKEPAKARGIDLKRMMGRATDEPPDPAAQKLDQTIHCHPALFTVEYALARLWLDWGVQPDKIVGHSMGEYVAACLAGVFSLEDALTLVAVRAKLVNVLPQGAMLAVMLPEEKLVPLLSEQLSISLINGPNLCVVAGSVAAIADLQGRLKAAEIIFRPVRNAHAFHSRMLDPIVDSYASEVQKVRRNVPRIPFISNVTGTWITEEQALDPFYWVDHARRTARFSDALGQMWKLPDCLPLEVGPGRTLGMLAMQHPARTAAGNQAAISSLRHDYENQPDADFILNSVGRLWLAGTQINWEQLDPRSTRRKISLPTHPFERPCHGIEPPAEPQSAAVVKNSPAQGTDVADGLTPSASANQNALPPAPNHQAERVAPPNPDARLSAGKFARPSTPTEIALAKIWSEVLGLEDIGLRDNFFHIFGHSLQAMRVVVEIEKHFKRPLSLGSLFTFPTIFQLSRLLDENVNRALVALSDGLRGTGNGVPLFYIPQGHGFGFIPKELAGYLSERCRFYDGLQYPGMKAGEPLPTSLEEIAAYLIPQIQSVWPDGPYCLIGWSTGGVVAFEVARQMEALGLDVKLVVLLDARFPAGSTGVPEGLRKRSVVETVNLIRRHLSTLNGRERAAFLRELAINKLRFLSPLIKRFGETKREAQLLPIMEATYRAIREHRSWYYGGRVVLMRMEIENSDFYSGFRYAPDPTFGWGNVARGGVEVLYVAGDHFTMILEPAVGKLAEQIADILMKATSERHCLVA